LAWNWSDQRARSIRYVLGPHQAGFSDPVTWLDNMRSTIRDPSELYGTHTFAEAVGTLLARGEYSQAMWAARLTTALEYPEEGERLTDQVLEDPGVREAPVEMLSGKKPWEQVMMPPKPPGETAEEIPEVKPVTKAQETGIQEH